MGIEFNTQVGDGVYHIQIVTDDKQAYLVMQEIARQCIDGNLAMQELVDTIAEMCSADYKERFKAEYYQLKIRYKKLKVMCAKYEDGTLEFEPTCSLELLLRQLAAMHRYLKCLEKRAEVEGIEL